VVALARQQLHMWTWSGMGATTSVSLLDMACAVADGGCYCPMLSSSAATCGDGTPNTTRPYDPCSPP
jgi:hypothetical protein